MRLREVIITRYLQKIVPVKEVFRWFKHGDHLGVMWPTLPDAIGHDCCLCGRSMLEHGFMGDLICPGSWVVVRADGFVSVYSDNQFHKKFEKQRCLNI